MAEIDRKDALRSSVSTARAALSPAQWAADDAERTRHLFDVVDDFPPGIAAVYVSRSGEPDTHRLIEGLVRRGWQVIVPKLRRSPDWAPFTGWDDLIPGWAHIPHPAGPGIGPDALRTAHLIFLPCLALGRDGSRLGSGGGWYDRALAHGRRDALKVALARADEVFDTVPSLPHDVAVDGYVTEDGWTTVAR